MVNISGWENLRKKVTGSYSEKLTLEIAQEEARAAAVAKAARERVATQQAAAKIIEERYKAETAAKVAAKVAEVKAAAKPQVVAKPTPKPKPVVKKAPAKKVVAFDPKAKDADGDGKIQDGTIHERPAPAKKPATKKVAPAKKATTKKPSVDPLDMKPE